VDGGQFAPASGTAGVFLNARWQVNASAAYSLPGGVDVAANVFGRQGYPFAPFRQVALGAEALQVLLTPRIDTFRLSNLWNTDLRFSKTLFYRGARVRLVGGLFNLFNANTELQRVRNAGAPNCRALAQNLSPRILRLGLTVGF
jgi:hypothetical protein